MNSDAMLILLQSLPRFQKLEQFRLCSYPERMNEACCDKLLEVLPDVKVKILHCEADFSARQDELLNAVNRNTSLQRLRLGHCFTNLAGKIAGGLDV